MYYHDNLDMAIVVATGAFLTTDMYYYIPMVLRFLLTEIMAKTDQIICRKCVTFVNDPIVLYIQLQKELYGFLRRLLLFRENISRDLELRVFFVGHYDPHVTNLTANGSQMKITWNINNTKISYVDANEVKNYRMDEGNVWRGHEIVTGR